MLEKIEIKKMIYVDEVPAVDQIRIPWIKNGESLDGAKTTTGHEGGLNAAPYAIYENTKIINENIENSSTKINQLVESVNKITDSLDYGGEGDVISKISKNSTDIIEIKAIEEDHNNRINDIETSVKTVDGELGEFSSNNETIKRTIRDDLFWIKSQLGNYSGEDINGTLTLGLQASGIKRRVIDNSESIASHNIKIIDLEDKFLNANVDQLNNTVQNIVSELGTPTVSGTVYDRININENKISEINKDIQIIKDDIDFQNSVSIANRTQTSEQNIETIEDKIDGENGVVSKIDIINTTIGSVSDHTSVIGRLSTAEDDVSNIWKIVGHDKSSGLQKHADWVNTQIGISSDGETPKAGSILDKLTSMSSQTNQMQANIQDIQAEIGNNTEGLKGKINTISSRIDGNGNTEGTIDDIGIYNYSKYLSSELNNKLSNSPDDGSRYVRAGNSWVKIPSAIGQFENDSVSIDFSEGIESAIFFNQLNAESWNKNITTDNQYIVVQESGVFRLNLKTEIQSSFAHLKLSIKINDEEKTSTSMGAMDAGGEYQIVNLEKLFKLEAGDKISLTATPLSGESNIVISLNNVEFTLTPII